MTIKNLLSKFRLCSNAKVKINEVNGGGVHTVSNSGIKDWFDKGSGCYDAPILYWKVNSFEIIDNELTINADAGE